MVFFIRFFPRKLEKKVFSNPTILNSKNFMIDIPLKIAAAFWQKVGSVLQYQRQPLFVVLLLHLCLCNLDAILHVLCV